MFDTRLIARPGPAEGENSLEHQDDVEAARWLKTQHAELFSVAERVVLITGGTSGIGLMLAEGFVSAGAHVYVTSRKADACQVVSQRLNEIGKCAAIVGDVGSEEGCRSIIEELSSQVGCLDVLINSAGATWGAPLEEHDEASWRRVMNVNLGGTFQMARLARPLLEQGAGTRPPARIVNIGSADGLHVPMWDTFSYSASKAAVHHLTAHLAKSLGPTITVNAIAPGAFPSRMMRVAFETQEKELREMSPLGRTGGWEDIVGAAIYLTSKAGSWVTGTILVVDGGAVSTL